MKKIIIFSFILILISSLSAFADDLGASKSKANSELDGIFSLYDEFDYKEDNWLELVAAYNNGKNEIINATTEADIFKALNEAAEEMISVRHSHKMIPAYISVENLVLRKGFIIFPTSVKVPKYQSVSKAVSKLIETKNQGIRQPLLFSGSVEKDFEIKSVYTGLSTNIADDTELKVPNFLISHLGDYLQEPTDKTYLNSGDYTPDSCFIYSVNNKFPNVKASAIPVVYDDVIRVQFSVYGKGADVGARIHTSAEPLFSPADKTELFTLLAKTVYENDMELLLSDKENEDKFQDVLVVAELVNVSQLAVNRAKKKLLSLKPVSAPEELPEQPSVENPDATPPSPSESEPEAKPVIFLDVTDGHFAKESIDYLSAMGVFNGRPDGSFGINDNITRGELVTIIARFEKASDKTELPFEDVKSDDWFAEGVAFCYKNGITNGKSAKEFMPNALITRQELATMLYRYMNYKNISKDSEEKPDFNDTNTIAEYAQAAVNALKDSGIISGRENNTFSPIDNATRGETAKMFYNTVK